MVKIIRSICYFVKKPNQATINRLNKLESRLKDKGFVIQTKRICSPRKSFSELKKIIGDNSILLSIGTLKLKM